MDKSEHIIETLNYLKANMATKDDIKDFAKKSDLRLATQNTATKDDMKDFAKKSDLHIAMQNMATKDDLKDFAKKSDLHDMATKQDLQRFASKSDLESALENMVSQSDLALTMDAFERRFDQNLDQKLDKRFDRFEQQITQVFEGKLHALRSDIMTHLDGFIYLYKKVDVEVTALHGRVTRLESAGQ